MPTLISRSPSETEALGAALARTAAPGMVFGLVGPLGAGKTQFARGVARGLGIAGRIPSPTFALVQTHAGGRLPLHHLDLYRLERAEEIHAAGLDEFVPDAAAVTVVEWFDRWPGAPPPRLVRVTFEPAGDAERRITHDDPRA
ncbi:MAG: tRNA (adenosine(37)-N6)-threonylcarbamoyltransferase complex ATPase subunit type 1 TsaE [Limisphaerales bacterium]